MIGDALGGKRPSRGSGVRGGLKAIDDRENLIHPVFSNQVDRPLSAEVTMRTEQPHSRVAGRIHLGKLPGQPFQSEEPVEAIRPGRRPPSLPTRNGLWGRLQKLRDLASPDAAGLSDAVELSSYSCRHWSSILCGGVMDIIIYIVMNISMDVKERRSQMAGPPRAK